MIQSRFDISDKASSSWKKGKQFEAFTFDLASLIGTDSKHPASESKYISNNETSEWERQQQLQLQFKANGGFNLEQQERGANKSVKNENEQLGHAHSLNRVPKLERDERIGRENESSSLIREMEMEIVTKSVTESPDSGETNRTSKGMNKISSEMEQVGKQFDFRPSDILSAYFGRPVALQSRIRATSKKGTSTSASASTSTSTRMTTNEAQSLNKRR